MSTSKLSSFRKRGVIPAKRHDAFLLALLLAVLFNVAVFAIQALLPKIALLISLLGATPLPPPEDKQMPFVLVDPSLFEEVREDLPADAEGMVSREARQTVETPDLPEQTSFLDEGIDEILTGLPGNPLPDASEGNAEEEVSQPTPPSPDQPEIQQVEAAEPLEAQEQVEEVPEPIETPQEPAPEPAPELPQPPEPEPEQPQPEPIPESPPEVEPEPAEPMEEMPETLPEDLLNQLVDPEPTEVEQRTEQLSEIIDLAALPVSPDGFVDSSTRELEEAMRRPEVIPQPRPEELRRPKPEQPQPEQMVAQQPSREPVQPQEARPAREGRPQPVFKKIGSEPNKSGSPPRRRDTTSVKLLGDDASMRILQHRYGAYMDKLARQLQESLIRVMLLSRIEYNRGQVKIRFGIAPDGRLSFFETIYVLDGMDSERILSERMLIEAAPFDPLTPEMQQDENFQKMTVVVNLM